MSIRPPRLLHVATPVIAATTAFLTLSLAAQAGAAPTAGFERCPPGHLCLFDGTNYTGSRRDIIPSTDLAGRWDNRVSSLRSGLCPA